MTLASPFMAFPFARGFQPPKHGGHRQTIASAHGVQQQGHAAAAIRAFAKGTVDLAGGDDRPGSAARIQSTAARIP